MEARPPADAVAQRALCAGAIFTRGFIERNVQVIGHPLENWDQPARQIGSWLSAQDLIPQHTSRFEVQLLAAPLGSWSADAIAEVGWRSEAIAVLLWALGLRHAIAPYDRPVDALEFERVLPILGDAVPFVAAARLRDAGEVDRERDLAELWHWRSRAARAQQSSTGVENGSLISLAAHSAHEEGLLPGVVDDDFPAYGRPYRELGDEQLAEAAAVARERRMALNWLTGTARDWDESRQE